MPLRLGAGAQTADGEHRPGRSRGDNNNNNNDNNNNNNDSNYTTGTV